jgi:phage terminase large subunit-like protein
MAGDGGEPGLIAPRLISGLLGCASYGDEVAALAFDVLGITLMPWQKLAISGQLEHDENGDLVRRRSLVSVARQNGKTVALKSLLLWMLVKEPIRRGEPILAITTAHQLDLAVELFEQLAPVLETKFGAKAYWSYGRNEILMPDESRWLVQAATPKAFHGFSPTYIIADEVWNISADVLFTGALPSQRAMKSPLLSCWSTAGTEDSHALLKMREEGLRAIDEKKFSKLFFCEWSVPPGVDPITEKSYWPWANPAIGYTLDAEILVDESEQVDKAAFMRASLNLWISSANSWLNPGVFDKLVTTTMPVGGVLCVDSSIDESLYCGIRAQLNDDGQIAVTVEFVTDTLGACWEKVQESAKTCRQVALTPSLFQLAPMDLSSKKIDVGYGELVTHTATIRQLINEGRLVHTGEQMLLEHVNRAVGVKTQGGYVISSQKSSGPITMARCMIFAAALIAKPTQKARAAIAFSR